MSSASSLTFITFPGHWPSSRGKHCLIPGHFRMAAHPFTNTRRSLRNPGKSGLNTGIRQNHLCFSHEWSQIKQLTRTIPVLCMRSLCLMILLINLKRDKMASPPKKVTKDDRRNAAWISILQPISPSSVPLSSCGLAQNIGRQNGEAILWCHGGMVTVPGCHVSSAAVIIWKH